MRPLSFASLRAYRSEMKYNISGNIDFHQSHGDGPARARRRAIGGDDCLAFGGASTAERCTTEASPRMSRLPQIGQLLVPLPARPAMGADGRRPVDGLVEHSAAEIRADRRLGLPAVPLNWRRHVQVRARRELPVQRAVEVAVWRRIRPDARQRHEYHGPAAGLRPLVAYDSAASTGRRRTGSSTPASPTFSRTARASTRIREAPPPTGWSRGRTTQASGFSRSRRSTCSDVLGRRHYSRGDAAGATRPFSLPWSTKMKRSAATRAFPAATAENC